MIAGHNFKCSMCHDDYPEETAEYDAQMGGPICLACKKDVVKIEAWLKFAGMGRPLATGDINASNHRRFKTC
jgi:NAD-dependent SIR2 family protein deacetylase